MLTNIKISKVFFLVEIVMLVLLCMNFQSNASTFLLILVFLIFLKFILFSEKMFINIEFILLILTFTSYFIIYASYFSITTAQIFSLGIGPILGYFVGYNIFDENISKSYLKFIFAIIIGFFVHGFLNIMIFLQSGNIMSISARYVNDIWTGEILSATGQAPLFAGCIGLLFYAVFLKIALWKKLFIFFMIISSIINSLCTATRTPLYLLLIIFIANIALFFYLNNDKKKLKLIIYILGICLLVFLLYMKNIFGIRDIVESSNLFLRITSDEFSVYSSSGDSRFDRYIYTLKNLFTYPFGGGVIRSEIGYAHNLWLDVFQLCGVIPFILLIIYTCSTFISLFKFIKSSYISQEYKYISFSVYLAFTLNFMVEPILEGIPYLFIAMCIINGLLRKELFRSYTVLKKYNY